MALRILKELNMIMGVLLLEECQDSNIIVWDKSWWKCQWKQDAKEWMLFDWRQHSCQCKIVSDKWCVIQQMWLVWYWIVMLENSCTRYSRVTV